MNLSGRISRYCAGPVVGGALLLAGVALAAEPVDVKMGSPMPHFDKLKPGTRYYLRYFVSKDGVAIPGDLQKKEVRFEEKDGKKRLRILQDWVGNSGSLHLDSWFESQTFRPLTHQRDRRKEGVVEREGFQFLGDKIVGLADQFDNSRRDFEISAPVPTFNFETDLETLQVLPLTKGAEFRIVFYHPGGEPPAPYIFKVAGEEILQVAGVAMPAWIVTTDYNSPNQPLGRFWIAKGSQEVVRFERMLPDGRKVVKVLL